MGVAGGLSFPLTTAPGDEGWGGVGERSGQGSGEVGKKRSKAVGTRGRERRQRRQIEASSAIRGKHLSGNAIDSMESTSWGLRRGQGFAVRQTEDESH